MRKAHVLGLAGFLMAATTARAEEAPAEAPKVSYKNGFQLATADDEFALKIVGRVQPRFTFKQDLTDGASGDVNAANFEIARARLTLEGHAYETVGYKFQTEFGKGFVYLRDYYIDPKIGGVYVRAGQWKKPFSRQQITSSANMQLVDRAITDKFSGAGRDIGVAVHNNYEKSPGFEWVVGVFNGTGEKPHIDCAVDTTDPAAPTAACEQTNVPKDIGPQVGARVGYNHGGIKGYSESDLEGGPLRLAVAVSYLGALAQGESDLFMHRVGPDLLLKVSGFSLGAAAYMLKAGDADAELGYHGQAGYFLVPKKIEAAARYAAHPAGAEDKSELTGGVNWFFAGHALKWQTDAGMVTTTGAPDDKELIVRTQAQLIF